MRKKRQTKQQNNTRQMKKKTKSYPNSQNYMEKNGLTDYGYKKIVRDVKAEYQKELCRVV